MGWSFSETTKLWAYNFGFATAVRSNLILRWSERGIPLHLFLNIKLGTEMLIWTSSYEPPLCLWF